MGGRGPRHGGERTAQAMNSEVHRRNPIDSDTSDCTVCCRDKACTSVGVWLNEEGERVGERDGRDWELLLSGCLL